MADIVWNFTCYNDHRRITLGQNPHFYLSLPRGWDVYEPPFSTFKVKDSIPILRNDTVFVAVDKPSQSRVFLHTGQGCRIFGNVWKPDDDLIFNGFCLISPNRHLISDVFPDVGGRPRRERLLRCHTFEGILDMDNGHCDSRLMSLYSDSGAKTLNRTRQPLSPNYINIHIVGTIIEEGSHLVSTDGGVCFCALPQDSDTRTFASNTPPPPASERPRRQVLYTCYTAINMLNDDVLLVVFNHCRLDNEINWNRRLGWCHLTHVCQRWRRLVFGSAFHLGMHILCTNGTPLVGTLVHLPPLPLVVEYRYATATMGALDKLGILLALQLRDRLRRVVLRIPPSVLDQLLVVMDRPFPVLEHLSLSSSIVERTILLLPKTFVTPNLRHLTLLGIGLPKKLLLLSSTVSLVTLTLTNIREFGYFLPQHLVARIRALTQLEELSIGFAIPLPRPSNERELLEEMEAFSTLPLLKRLTFRGVSAYLESFVAQIRAPLLERLNITLFNQVHFALPHLSHFTSTTAGLMFPFARIIFMHGAVSMIMDHPRQRLGGPSNFVLCVTCKQFDWQVDSAAQICTALRNTLSGVEQLTLDFEGQRVPAAWEDNAVDGATWRELLRPFTGVKKLRICQTLAWELSCALQSGFDPELLPSLDELAPELEEEHVRDNAFVSFIDARQAVGRTVLLLASPVSREESTIPLPQALEAQVTPSDGNALASLESPALPSKKGGWIRRAIIRPFRKRLG
jgi:hypothetical protein